MRVTVDLSDDVLAGVRGASELNGTGFDETVNDLIRRGLAKRPESKPFKQRAQSIGIGADVSDIADAIESLDSPDKA